VSSLSICPLLDGFVPTVAKLSLVVALTACGPLERTWNSIPEASKDPAVRAADFPTLGPAPKRPPAGASLARGSALEKEMAALRDSTRYTGDAVRYETGRISVPPSLPQPLPPAAPPDATAASAAAGVVTGDIEVEGRGYAEDNDISEDDRSLDDFLDALQVGDVDIQVIPDNVPIIDAPDDAAEQGSSDTDITANQAIADIDPTVIDFVEAATVVPIDAVGPLQLTARALIDAAAGARIVAEGSDQAMALARAQAVAAMLVARGVEGRSLAVETAGPGNRVVVYAQPIGG